MTNPWILFAVIVGILAAVLGVIKLRERLVVARMRRLTCPRCSSHFSVRRLSDAEPWFHVSVDPGRERASRVEHGYYLFCHQCGAKVRFSKALTLLGPADDAASSEDEP
jgi:RNase P subunit RPR2